MRFSCIFISFCRTRSGEVPPLDTRATLAAWATENGNAAQTSGPTPTNIDISSSDATGILYPSQLVFFTLQLAYYFIGIAIRLKATV